MRSVTWGILDSKKAAAEAHDRFVADAAAAEEAGAAAVAAEQAAAPMDVDEEAQIKTRKKKDVALIAPRTVRKNACYSPETVKARRLWGAHLGGSTPRRRRNQAGDDDADDV